MTVACSIQSLVRSPIVRRRPDPSGVGDSRRSKDSVVAEPAARPAPSYPRTVHFKLERSGRARGINRSPTVPQYFVLEIGWGPTSGLETNWRYAMWLDSTLGDGSGNRLQYGLRESRDGSQQEALRAMSPAAVLRHHASVRVL